MTKRAVVKQSTIARAIRNGADFVPAAAIRKDGRVMHPIDRQNQSAMNLKAGMCDCFRCIRERGDIRLRMGSCACGNKRCPKSSDHRLECTGSNEPGQEGSIFKKVTP